MAAKAAARRGKPPRRWRQIIDECVGKALSNSFRQQILWIINERPASPSEIAQELGETLNKVCHHVDVLKNANCIEVAYTRVVGNRVQRFYKANSRAFLDDVEWPKVPASLIEGLRATLLRNIVDDAIAAVVDGTYDSIETSPAHMSWTPMILDALGWEELTEILERALLEAVAVQESAKERLIESDETGTSCTVSILGYASVGGRKKVSPPSDAQELIEAARTQPEASSRRGSTKKASKKKKTAAKKDKTKARQQGKGAS
jgi:predicted ArsR family transcriptional regulator